MMYMDLTQLHLFLATISLSLAQICDQEIVVNKRIPLTGSIVKGYKSHEIAGLSKECIEAEIPVEKNSVRCFKWRLRTNQVQLNERRISNHLVTEVPNEVTFRSPGFFNKKTKHYSNSMFCVYNISLDNCKHTKVYSSIRHNGHSLYNDSKDYLSVYLSNRHHNLYGDEVGSFADDTSSGSLYAVLWSDSEKHSSRGTFELTARCHSQNTDEAEDGSGLTSIDI